MVKRLRSVAIELATWRSGRRGGFAVSSTEGKARFFALRLLQFPGDGNA